MFHRSAITISILVCTACGSGARSGSPVVPADDPLRALLKDRVVIFGHLASRDAQPRNAEGGVTLGVVQELPRLQTPRYQSALDAARAAYGRGEFAGAVAIMRPALDDEPDNPFIMWEYARALFRIDSVRPSSRIILEKLERTLAAQARAPAGSLFIDMWFTDAYWKLALLYLDEREYRKALEELSKVSSFASSAPVFREQLYALLAETFFHLGQQDNADWYVERTLSVNPRNDYVLQFRKR